jgi:methionyl-tRNA synthetase
MAKKYCQGRVPNCEATDISVDNPLKILGQQLGAQVSLAYNNLAFKEACESIIALAHASNKYIDDLAPWALFKQDKQAELAEVLYAALESARLAAYLLAPIAPKISTDIYQQLGLTIDFDLAGGNDFSQFDLNVSNLALNSEHHLGWGLLKANDPLGEPRPIFTKLELLLATNN